MNLDQLLSLPLTTVHTILGLQPQPTQIMILEELTRRFEANAEQFRYNNTDAVHNLVMSSHGVERPDLGRRILEVAIDVYEDNVDLLADLLQEYYGRFQDPEKAEQIWQRLKAMPAEKRELNWRYWVFGGLYHARMKGDIATARALMLEGVKKVAGNQKSDVLRNIEDVLIDHSSNPDFDETLRLLKQGVEAGYEGGYTVAQCIAVILQRRSMVVPDGNEQERRQMQLNNLRKALNWLTIAEAIFTNDPRHTISDVYRERVNVLMGLGDYREAIEYMTALIRSSPSILDRDKSIKTQFILACERIGTPDLWQNLLAEIKASGEIRGADGLRHGLTAAKPEPSAADLMEALSRLASRESSGALSPSESE